MSLAALGQRNMDDGQEHVEDPWLRARLRRQARGIVVKASLAGAAATAVVMLL